MQIEIDPISAFISFFALLTSSVAVITMIRHNSKKYRHTDYVSNESKFIELEMMLKDVPSALKFHGIYEEDLNAVGITGREFSYLLANFTTGCMEFRASNIEFDDIELSSYRITMLESEDTRKAWPFLKKAMSSSPCREKIEEKIREIEARSS